MKEDMCDPQAHKKGSVSLGIWKMEIKPAMKYHDTPTRMIKI